MGPGDCSGGLLKRAPHEHAETYLLAGRLNRTTYEVQRSRT